MRCIIGKMDKEKLFIEQAKKKDEQAFKKLIEPYIQKLLNTGYYILKNREDAWDILQDTLLLLWKNMKKIDPSYPFYPYLRKMYINQCFKHLKKTKDKNELSFDYEYEEDTTLQIEDVVFSPEELLQKKELKEKIKEIMDKMPPHYSSTLWLRIGENMSYKEISEVLGVNIGTVKSRINMARRLLSEELLSYLGGE